MLSMKWIAFFASIWIICVLLAATFDGGSSDASTWGPEEETTLEYLSDLRKVTYAEDETGPLAYLTPNDEYFDAMGELVTWNFGFLKCSSGDDDCGYAYFRYIVLTPITLAAIFGLFLIFVQILQGLFSAIF